MINETEDDNRDGDFDRFLGWTCQRLAELRRTSAELGNVPMLNCEIYQEGTFSPKTVELIRTAAQQAGLLK